MCIAYFKALKVSTDCSRAKLQIDNMQNNYFIGYIISEEFNLMLLTLTICCSNHLKCLLLKQVVVIKAGRDGGLFSTTTVCTTFSLQR